MKMPPECLHLDFLRVTIGLKIIALARSWGMSGPEISIDSRFRRPPRLALGVDAFLYLMFIKSLAPSQVGERIEEQGLACDLR